MMFPDQILSLIGYYTAPEAILSLPCKHLQTMCSQKPLYLLVGTTQFLRVVIEMEYIDIENRFQVKYHLFFTLHFHNKLSFHNNALQTNPQLEHSQETHF